MREVFKEKHIINKNMENTGIVNGKLVGLAQVLIQELDKEGKVTVLSKEATSELDNTLAKEMQKIKKEFDLLRKRSWYAMKGIIIS